MFYNIFIDVVTPLCIKSAQFLEGASRVSLDDVWSRATNSRLTKGYRPSQCLGKCCNQYGPDCVFACVLLPPALTRIKTIKTTFAHRNSTNTHIKQQDLIIQNVRDHEPPYLDSRQDLFLPVNVYIYSTNDEKTISRSRILTSTAILPLL